MNNDMIKNLAIDYLQKTDIGVQLQNTMALFQKAQETVYTHFADESPDNLKMIRIGTVLCFSIVNKVAKGKDVKSFTDEDWKEVASNIADYAILQCDERFSIAVFDMYARYVDISVEVLKARGASDDKCEKIQAIADNVRELSESLRDGEITEVDYTEKCLWLLLEAMVKLLATYSGLFVGEDAAEFIQSASQFAFEYGRYTLYKQEQEILEMYLANQNRLDEELIARLEEYKAKLQERHDEFESLIEDAFSSDAFSRFKASVAIARSVGVDSNEVLDTADKIDDFFMD